MNPLRHYHPGDLVVCNIGTDYAATTRYAMVEQASQHDESLCLVDCDGREILGNVVSVRLMSDSEVEEWSRYESEQADCRACSPGFPYCWEQPVLPRRRLVTAKCAALVIVEAVESRAA